MGDVTPVNGLSDDDKEYNWTVMVPMIIFLWSAIGAIIFCPDLLIKCYKIACCKKQSEQLSRSDGEEPENGARLADKIKKDLTKIGEGSSSDNPCNSPQPTDRYNKLQEERNLE